MLNNKYKPTTATVPAHLTGQWAKVAVERTGKASAGQVAGA